MLLSLFILMFQLTQIWSMGSTSSWFLCPFEMPSIILGAHSYFLAHQDILDSFCAFLFPSPTISYFSQFIGECHLKHQDLGTRCTHCFWNIVVSRPSQWTEIENISSSGFTIKRIKNKLQGPSFA